MLNTANEIRPKRFNLQLDAFRISMSEVNNINVKWEQPIYVNPNTDSAHSFQMQNTLPQNCVFQMKLNLKWIDMALFA